jgi:hypothetical protein
LNKLVMSQISGARLFDQREGAPITPLPEYRHPETKQTDDREGGV